MKSIDEKTDSMTLGELKTLLKKLPGLEEKLDAFASDFEKISSNQPLMSNELLQSDWIIINFDVSLS